MKKFAVIFGLICIIFVQALAFADEIVDAQGKVIQCKITDIENGLIEYEINGMPRTFTREAVSPVFNDYIDVQTNLLSKKSIVRYTGRILIKDMQEVLIQTEEGNMRVPWYKIKKIGVYKP